MINIHQKLNHQPSTSLRHTFSALRTTVENTRLDCLNRLHTSHFALDALQYISRLTNYSRTSYISNHGKLVIFDSFSTRSATSNGRITAIKDGTLLSMDCFDREDNCDVLRLPVHRIPSVLTCIASPCVMTGEGWNQIREKDLLLLP